jgi:hypothetical protein
MKIRIGVYVFIDALWLLQCAFVTHSAGAAATQPGKISDPKVAASRLYQASRAGRRSAAVKVATTGAVDKLFGVRRRAMRFEGCRHYSKGGSGGIIPVPDQQ